MAIDLLSLLRARTRAGHAALEGVPSMRALQAPAVSLGDYREALVRLLALHRSLGARLARAEAGAEAGGLPETFLGGGRVDDLLADLRALGWAPSPLPLSTEGVGGVEGSASPGAPEGLGGVERSAAPGAPEGLPEALGILYVIEGSRLGGAVLGRHLGPALGLDRDHGLRFFLGPSGEDPSARWRELCALLAAHSTRDERFAGRVVAAADRCFDEARCILAGAEP